jgi:Arc/MetJ family transcription regulator
MSGIKRSESGAPRKARLGAALRENLKRRKAQARQRAGRAERPGRTVPADRNTGEGDASG